MKILLALVISFQLHAEDQEFEGKTDLYRNECSFSLEGEKIGVYEYRKKLFGRGRVVKKKIEMKRYDSFDTGLSETGLRYNIYRSMKQRGPLVKEEKIIYVYFDENDQVSRSLALFKLVPIVGGVSHDVISCLSNAR